MSESKAEAPGLLVIVGPTGAGKTGLAIQAAERGNAEIISADSQQVYRGMDIGTGKATSQERARVPHHLLDVCEPDQEMTAGRFVELADAAIGQVRQRGKSVIIAGGTMLYVRALLRGLFEGPAANEELRASYQAKAKEEGVAALWAALEKVDLISAGRIHDTDERRLIRALEVHTLTGVPLSEHHRQHQAQPPRYQAKIVGIEPARPVLYEQIDARVEGMLAAGLVEEVKGLASQGYGPQLRSQQAIGYAEVHKMLGGEIDLAEMKTLVQRNSRRYARRQMSWYRGDARVRWWQQPAAVDLEELERYLRGCDD